LPHASVTWLEKGRFVGIDSSRHSVVLSTQDDENGVGMRPSELLLIALASCSAVDVVNILKKKRLHLRALSIEVKGEQQAEPPWTYQGIHLTYRLMGDDLTEEAVRQAIQLSEEKYCSVSASLRVGVPITHDYQIDTSDGKLE
jgi:putative redox protein